MKVIIDECIYSPKFMTKLKKNIPEHQFLYLGHGLQDIDIERYLIAHDDAVLVTGDNEFDTHFDWRRSLYVSLEDSLKDKIDVIKAWVTK